MGTAATPTKILMSDASGGQFKGIFTLLLDSTDGSGLMTVDLTDYFAYVHSCKIGGSLAANFYYVETQVPGPTVALTSTNLVLGFSEAGVDADVLDAVATTSFATKITGLTLVVKGKQAA